MKNFFSFLGKAAFLLPLIFGAFSTPANAWELKSGDVLLQPLNCWSCSLIEAQEKSIYSHMGVYVEVDGKAYVLEAWQTVKLTPLKEFLAKTEQGQSVRVKRFKEKRFDRESLLAVLPDILGLSYDSNFLWDNFDERGEKLYCSEMAYKLFYPFYGEALPIKRMRYDVYREHWRRFFGGNIPDGKWGNAPADFDKSDLLKTLGDL
ncbi:MAG: YiiX/YebB-like N1pC/P60 family cysteine hydrolase [Bacteriovoracaceae bacterium]